MKNFNPNHDEKGRFAKSPFKNSKIQKYVYHNSKKDFDKFDLNYFGGTDLGSYCKGIYFSGNTEEIKKYGNKQYKAYIDIKNPIYFEGNEKRFSVNFRDYKNKDKLKKIKENLTQQLIQEGYDGVIAGDSQYIVFDPKQIKIVDKYDI